MLGTDVVFTWFGTGVFAKPYVDAFSDDEDDDDDDQHGNFQASLSARVDDSSASAADHLSPIPAAQPEVREQCHRCCLLTLVAWLSVMEPTLPPCR